MTKVMVQTYDDECLNQSKLGNRSKQLKPIEYAEAYGQAIWLEGFRLKNQQKCSLLCLEEKECLIKF